MFIYDDSTVDMQFQQNIEIKNESYFNIIMSSYFCSWHRAVNLCLDMANQRGTLEGCFCCHVFLAAYSSVRVHSYIHIYTIE